MKAHPGLCVVIGGKAVELLCHMATARDMKGTQVWRAKELFVEDPQVINVDIDPSEDLRPIHGQR